MVANLNATTSNSVAQGHLGATSGTNTMTTTPAPTLVNGYIYTVIVTNAQTVVAPTLNGTTIVKRAATPLASGDMPAGAVALLFYNGTDLKLLNPVIP